MMDHNHIEEAAEAMSALYVWDCVTSILEGSASPARMGGREEADVQRVIKIASAAQQRMLKAYDRAAARAAKGE
ncbi:hypothetical protein [Castellaniella sp. UC4442_H9]